METDPVALIRKWFFTPPTPAEDAAGDFPVEVNFEAHVRCVEMPPGTHYVAQVDPATISPSGDRYFIFYTVERDHVMVWGGLTGTALLALHEPGLVRRDEDLLWQPANVSRCRGQASRLVPLEPRRPLSQLNPHLFLLPVFDEDDPAHSEEIGADVFDAFYARLRWLSCPTTKLRPFRCGTTIWDHMLEKASFLLCATVTPYLSSGDAAIAYETRRMDRERWLFMQRMEPFMESERALLWLLAHNKGLWAWLKKRVVVRCPEDEQAFVRLMREHNTPHAEVPTMWFAVPIWEAPLRRVAQEFPLHAGGVIHMPCYTQWVATWLWDAHVLAPVQRHFSSICQRIPLPLPPSPDLLGDVLRDAVAFVSGAEQENGVAEATQRAREKNNPKGEWQEHERPQVTVHVQDIEDIWKAAPPCVKMYREARGRFPTNMERVDLTQVLRRAFLPLGIPEAWIERFYELLNNRFPRDNQTLKQRYQIEGTIKSWKAKENPQDPREGAIWCRSLINRTVNRKDVERMACPVAAHMIRLRGGARPDITEVDEFSWRVRQECCAQTLPTRPQHWNPWKSPHMAMEEALKANAQVKAKE